VQVTLATKPADAARPNEDFVAASPDAAVLLDGAGTPTGSESGCTHGVAWFVRQLGTSLLAAITTDDTAELAACLVKAIEQVRFLHATTCDLDHPGSPSATVVALRTDGATVDYLVLADSVLVLDCFGELRVLTDQRELQVGRRFRARMDALPNGTSEHDEALRQYIEALRAHRNRDGGYWVASANPAAASQALTGSVARAELRAAALLSDGASRLVDRFGLATWQAALKTLDTLGPEELLRQVRAAERSDPNGRRWPRGKAYDDAAVAYCHEFNDAP
jgi:Protein phosphatase 2C